MKLPIPKLKLPSINPPFLKRKGGGDDFDLDAELDAQLEDDEPRAEPEVDVGGDSNPDDDGDDPFGSGDDDDNDIGDLDDLRADDGGDDDGLSRGQKVKNTLKKAGPVLMSALGGLVFFSLLGGVGGIVGWLWVNGPGTTSHRAEITPWISVPILEEGQEAEPNTSLDNLPDMKDEPASEETAVAENDDEAGQEKPDEEASTEAAGKASEKDASGMPRPPRGATALAPVDPALLDEVKDMVLPVIAADGRQSWEFYARPFQQTVRRATIAVIITDLGLNRAMTEAAIVGLPGAISLSFSPYAPDVEKWVDLSRRSGHETLLDLPMEPADFPKTDPGPQTLLASLDAVENLERLDWTLSRAQGYVGLVTRSGSRLTTMEEPLMPVLESLKQRGLLIVDRRDSSRSIAIELSSSIQLPRIYNNAFVDMVPNAPTIDRNLAELEKIAQRTGFAVGIARPYPVTINRLANWAPSVVERGMDLAPVSAIADKQRLR